MEQLGRIAEIAARYRIPVLADEIYKSFLYEGEFASITRFPGMRVDSSVVGSLLFASKFSALLTRPRRRARGSGAGGVGPRRP